jgi:hypothetical protein
MLLRIGRDGDLEVADRLDAGHEIAGLLKSAGMRLIGRADAGHRIAAKRHDVTHAGIPVGANNLVHVLFRGRNAGEVRSGLEMRFLYEPRDRGVGALAGGAAGAIGDGDELRIKGSETLDGGPERRLHLRGLRREELEGDLDRTGDLPAGTKGER